MTTFLSSFVNSVDKKGRVSVPAQFRAEIAADTKISDKVNVVVFASPDEPFLYAWGYNDFLKFAEKIKKLPPMSRERQRLSRSILAAARPLAVDGDGRIVLPEDFMKRIGVDSKAMFAGQGDYFTIWNPETFEAKQEEDLPFYDKDLDALTAWEGE